MHGQNVCGKHGGKSPQAIAAAEQRLAEEKAEAELTRRLGNAGTPIVDPIGTLCSIAGRAVKFMELIGSVVDQLEDGTPDEDSRADIALYERSMSRAAAIVESLIRMGIAERLAKVDEQFTASVVAFIDGVLADLGHDPRAPEVAGVVAARLELVS